MNTPLQEWMDTSLLPDNVVSPTLYYKGAAIRQCMYVRDVLAHAFASGLSYEDFLEMVCVNVISTHTSKSTPLPVYEMVRPELRIILRNNFYNWKLSVLSESPIDADFSGLFHTTPPIEPEYTGDSLHHVYFEGFPKDLIFGYYESSDHRRWSAEMHGDEQVWCALFLIGRALGFVEPMRWHTKESHRAELDRESAKSKARYAAERIAVGKRA